MRRLIPLVAAAAMLTASASHAGPAVAQFWFLDEGTNAWSITDDGSTVLTTGGDGAVFLCALDAGCEQIAPPGLVSGYVRLSGDGSTAIATIENASGAGSVARWTQSTGWEVLDPRPGQCGLSASSGYGLNQDGTVLTGLYWENCRASAFKYTDATGFVLLDSVIGPNGNPQSTRGNAVSGDGSTIGGWIQDCQRVGAYWMGGPSLSRVDPTQCAPGEVEWVSHDGSFMVGYSPAGPDGDQAFLYDAVNDILEPLGSVGAGSQFGDAQHAEAASEDAYHIVGWSGGVDAQQGWIWSDETGMLTVRQFLQHIGIGKKAYKAINCSFTYVMDITPDGSLVTGSCGSRAFMAHLGHVVCHRGNTVRVKAGRTYERHLRHGDTDGPCQ